MAAITHLFKGVGATETVTGTTQTEVTNYTVSWSALSAAGFSNGDVVFYILLCSGESESTTDKARIDGGYGSTFANAMSSPLWQFVIEGHSNVPDGGNNDGVHICAIRQVTLATNSGFYVGMSCDGSASEVQCGSFQLLILRKADLSTDDYFYASNSPGTSPTSYDTNGASATTPAAGDWWCIAENHWQPSNQNVVHYSAIGVDGTDYFENGHEREDSAEEYHLGSFWVGALSSGVTVRARAKQGGGSGVWANSYVFGLRLDAFKDSDFSFSNTSPSNTHTAVDTWTEQGGFGAYSPSQTGDVCIFAACMYNGVTNVTGGLGRIQVGGSDWISSLWVQNVGHQSSSGNEVQIVGCLGVASMTTGSKDIDFDTCEDKSVDPTPDPSSYGLCAVVFSMELAGGGTQALSGTTTGTGVVAGSIRVSANLTGAAPGTGVVAAALKGIAYLTATASGTGVVSAQIDTRLRLVASVVGTGTVSGQITVAASLSAAATGTGVVVAQVAVAAPLSGAVTGTGVVAGSLYVGASLTATTAGVGVVSGALDTALRIVGAATGTGVVVASVSVAASLSGTATGTGVVAGAIRVSASLSAATAGTGVVVASITATAASSALSGAVVGTGVVAGQITVDARLAAAAAGTGVVAASLVGDARLSGAATGTGSVAGQLLGAANFSATTAGTGVVTGGITVAANLSGAGVGTGTVAGSLVVDAFLSGAATGTGVVAASISTTADPYSLTAVAFGTGTVSGTLTVGPPDPDDDISYTVRTDCDGTTIRPLRGIVAHAFDGSREAELVGFDRMTYADRYGFISSRAGRNPGEGRVLRVAISGSGRAGEAGALRDLVLTLGARRRVNRAADTTDRTDSDGATLRPATLMAWNRADGGRDAELSTTGATSQNRREVSLPAAAGKIGTVHRLAVETDGRAGNACALSDFVLHLVPQAARREAADTTNRTDADGATLRIAPFLMSHVIDGGRDAELVTTGATTQDRFLLVFPAASSGRIGTTLRIALESDGRAGSAAALKDIIVRASATRRDSTVGET